MLRSDDVDKGAKRSEHENRFDRQLRLWGAHGQKLLESTQICALGSGPAISEALKNLVLPNVNEFTIVDDKKVTEVDQGNNFFVAEEDIGKARGDVVRENLLEMNPWNETEGIGVKGNFINKNPDKAIESGLEDFKQYDVILATEISDSNALKLSTYCYEHNITFVLIRINGLLGYIHWSKRQHLVTEEHPKDRDISDYHLHPEQLKNFPELENYLKDFDFKKLGEDVFKHSRIPWPAITYHMRVKWQEEKKKTGPPSNFGERNEFKQFIKGSAIAYMREKKLSFIEKNFEEAIMFAHKCCLKPVPDDEVQAVLGADAAKNLTSESDNFWIVVHAINKFMGQEGNGFLPVTGEIKDMESTPELYIRLQRTYQEQSKKEMAIIVKYAREAVSKLGKSADSIEDEYIVHVAKHIREAAVIKCKPISSVYDAKQMDVDEIHEYFDEWEELPEWDEEENGPRPLRPKNIHWYFALRAAERFRSKNGRYPGEGKYTFDDDVKELIKIQKAMFSEYSIERDMEEACLKEMVRSGGSQIHNVAALIGGVVSQLCLKLIVRQFVPFNNTYVFNGVHTTSNVFQL